jgi:hypothetical protein
MTNRLMMVFGFSALALLGAEGLEQTGPKRSFEAMATERVNFLPGGTIRLNNSYGYLTVEGWDEPEVEVIVTRSTDRFYEPEQKDKADQRLGQVHVVTQRRSEKELDISTTLSGRNSLFGSIWPLPHDKRGVTVDCTVHVPRDSRLIVKHDNGYVWVNDVTGDIDVESRTGDMIVMLPDPGPYSIDARTKLGSVSSDFVGKAARRLLVGSRYAQPNQGPSRRIYLRMGCGSIEIKNGPPSGPFWKN